MCITGGQPSITEKQFASLFPLVDAVSSDWFEKLFSSFDVNQNGRVDFRELADGMGALWRVAQKQMRVPGAVRSHGDSDIVRLIWPERPSRALIVKKWRDPDVTQMARDAGIWLQQNGVRVFVEGRVQQDDLKEFDAISEEQLSGDLAEAVDFVLCLGGDGTLLHLSSLLKGNGDNAIPPVVSFGLGSLGFLTPFAFADLEHCLTRILTSYEGSEGLLSPSTTMPPPISSGDEKRFVHCSIRSRLHCQVYSADDRPSVTSSSSFPFATAKIHSPSQVRPEEVRCVLNECLIDRGSSSHLTKLELYVDGHFVTNVQADGLIVATPSGSTAYSLAAGGSMIAPTVACTLVTPVAPHSLSFRPLVVDSSSVVDVCVPENARGSARISFDGRNTMELERGMMVRIGRSETPMPLVNMSVGNREWFDSIKQKLNFNKRMEQKSFSA